MPLDSLCYAFRWFQWCKQLEIFILHTRNTKKKGGGSCVFEEPTPYLAGTPPTLGQVLQAAGDISWLKAGQRPVDEMAGVTHGDREFSSSKTCLLRFWREHLAS